MISEINIRIRQSDNTGIFHDSRGDVKKLGEALNIVMDKINELIEVVNYQERIIKKLKDESKTRI